MNTLKLLALLFCGFLSSTHALASSLYVSMVGSWSFHQKFFPGGRPGDRWLLTHVEFLPNGSCVIRNQPGSVSCQWSQEATVATIQVYNDNGQIMVLWRGSLTDPNLFEGNGFVGTETVGQMFLVRDPSKLSLDAPLEVRSAFGSWNLQFRRTNGAWISNGIYFSQFGKCTLDEPFDSCTWTQNLKELNVVLRLTKKDAPLYLQAAPLSTRPSFAGKIYEAPQGKKEIGQFFLNAR